MNIIENLNPTEFTKYLNKYGNTICGRHPIGILLQVYIYIYICDPLLIYIHVFIHDFI